MRHIVVMLWALSAVSGELFAADRPNVVVILADDLGFSDLGCYGSEIRTPNLDRLASGGLRFSQFYNAARCCPTRASLLTGLYPHRAGVGHMLQDWRAPGYTPGLDERAGTIAESLRDAGYRTYHVGKWHVGDVAGTPAGRNHPIRRGFGRTFGTAGGGSFFALRPLYLDREPVEPGEDFYATDAFTQYAVRFLDEHGRDHRGQPFFLFLAYTAPHFPLHAKPDDIARYRGMYRGGWDLLRERRFARQQELDLLPRATKLSPRDPVAQPWAEVPEDARDEWDLRMAVHAAMIDCMDQGIGRVLEAIRRMEVQQNTLVVFLSDNGASAEFLDTWPNPARGHQPGSVTGTRESHRCLEVGWANASNTPFREHKMWVHEGGISTPCIAYWPEGIHEAGCVTSEVGHVIDLMATCLDLAGVDAIESLRRRDALPLDGVSLVPVFRGQSLGERTLAWEHEGNRAIRVGDWKLVAPFRGEWELYDLWHDRSETNNLASSQLGRVADLAARWQRWADSAGVVPWEGLPGSQYQPSATYRRKSEPPVR
jgi:arylsulfatase